MSIDETSHGTTSYIGFVIGVLNQRMKRRQIKVKELQAADGQSLAKEVLETLAEYSIPPCKVKLLVTDSAKAMHRCWEELKPHCPDLIHVYCLAHKLNLVSKFIQSKHKKVNNLIGILKQLLARSGPRRRIFKLVTGGQLPLPPTPHEIRWGTWQISANYLSIYIDAVVFFLLQLKPDKKGDASDLNNPETRLTKLQALLQNEEYLAELKDELKFLKSYEQLPQWIWKLEKSKVQFHKAMEVVEDVRKSLTDVVNRSTGDNQARAQAILNEFEGCIGDGDGLKLIQEKLSQDEDSFYQFSPLNSTDTERFFKGFRSNFTRTNRYFKGQNMAVITACKSALRPNRKYVLNRTTLKVKVRIIYFLTIIFKL